MRGHLRDNITARSTASAHAGLPLPFLVPCPPWVRPAILSNNFTRLSTERADTSSSPARNSSDLLPDAPRPGQIAAQHLSLACSLLGMENEITHHLLAFLLALLGGSFQLFLRQALPCRPALSSSWQHLLSGHLLP